VIAVTEAKTEDAAKAWDRYVYDHPSSSPYHLVAWRSVMERVCGHRTFNLMAVDDHNDVRGIVPLVFMSSRVFGHYLISMPFLNYGGIVSDDPEAVDALLNATVSVARDVGATFIELRHQAPLDVHWPARQHKVSMRLELPGDFASLWNGFGSKLRSQIRRAQKAGMAIRIGGRELLSDFYRIFARNMRDLGTPVYAPRFFQAVLETFSAETRICVAHIDGLPVAAGFLFGFRDGIEIPWASSDRRYNHLAPNMLLYSAVLDHVCREGFRWFDFGRSSPGSGTYRFKEQWGARPLPLHWHYWSNIGQAISEVSREHSMYRPAIKLWTRMPLGLTRIVGPMIVNHIP